jgi:hypothetical protein
MSTASETGSSETTVPQVTPQVSVTETEAYKTLTKKFGQAITILQLNQLASDAVKSATEVSEPTADQKRTTDALYQWFQANWVPISPFVDSLEIKNEDEKDEEEEKGEEAAPNEGQQEGEKEAPQAAQEEGKQEVQEEGQKEAPQAAQEEGKQDAQVQPVVQKEVQQGGQEEVQQGGQQEVGKDEEEAK